MAKKKGEGKYDKYFITDVVHDAMKKEWGGQMMGAGRGHEDIIPADQRAMGGITVVRKPYMFHAQSHTHLFTEYFFLWGSNPDDMKEFDGEDHYTFGPEMEKHIINRPMIVIAPPGVYHCPNNYAVVNKPFYCLELFASTGWNAVDWGENAQDIRVHEESYDRYFVDGVVKRNKWGGESMGLSSVPPHLIPPGARLSAGVTVVRRPYMFHEPTHKHTFTEFFYFFGTNPYDMKEFDAEVEFYFGEEREKHVIKEPTVVVAPPGVYHCPLNYAKVGKPFHCVEIFVTNNYTSTNLEEPKKKK